MKLRSTTPAAMPARWRTYLARRRRHRYLLRRRTHFVVRGEPQNWVLGGGCACCGALARHWQREWRAWGAHAVIVPYCEACAVHAARPRILGLAACLSSLLVGTAAAALLSLGAFASMWTVTCGAALLSVVPLLLAARVPLSRSAGHCAAGRAAFLVPDGLACRNPRWAKDLARRHHSTVERRRLAESRLSPLAITGPVVAFILAPAFYSLFHPWVRVVNLTDKRLELSLDGVALGEVAPSSGESPAAGRELRFAAGSRRLRATDRSGKVVYNATVSILGGRRHLFAPGAKAGCFFIERRAFGRAVSPEPKRQALAGDGQFWVIPKSVDAWFVDAPSSTQQSLTGGVVTLLRQGDCR